MEIIESEEQKKKFEERWTEPKGLCGAPSSRLTHTLWEFQKERESREGIKEEDLMAEGISKRGTRDLVLNWRVLLIRKHCTHDQGLDVPGNQ